jgi:OmpA-OmpF porin, OOP family
MRKFTFLALISLLVFTNTNVKAQNSDHHWAIGVYMNWVDFSLTKNNLLFPAIGDWQGKNQMIPSTFSLGRFISPSFNVVGALSTNKFHLQSMNEHFGYNLSTDKFWDADASLEYKFANGYILKESSWFAPYAYVGLGASNFDKTTHFKEVAGLGADFWILPVLALNAHGSANIIQKNHDYLQLVAGIKFRFGGGKDTDKDGVSDKKDLCPTEFGLKELGGCPDKDGDGIADKDDACPDVAGPKELNGCPDTDGDGILDKNDMCPTEKGSRALNGCPDRDGDGVADKDDKCPDVAGPAKFAGCPDKDGDGIPDKDDKCPDVAGTAANNGCPEVKTEVAKVPGTAEAVKLPGILKIVYFNIGHSSYQEDYSKDLDEVVFYMKQNADVKLNIDGYADEVCSVKFNLWLSDRRADVVIKYLKRKGVAPDRLIKTAYGKSKPIADNKTAEGRKMNRRVEIRIAK